jgi:hypothetical protein
LRWLSTAAVSLPFVATSAQLTMLISVSTFIKSQQNALWLRCCVLSVTQSRTEWPWGLTRYSRICIFF